MSDTVTGASGLWIDLSFTLRVLEAQALRKVGQSLAPSCLLARLSCDPWDLCPYDKPSKAVFPDGIKTSGQREPVYDQLKPYADFPREITGQTVWDRDDYQHNPERWVHHFTSEEKTELSAAADAFIASEVPLTGMTKENFPLPTLSGLMEEIRKEVKGKGYTHTKLVIIPDGGVSRFKVFGKRV